MVLKDSDLLVPLTRVSQDQMYRPKHDRRKVDRMVDYPSSKVCDTSKCHRNGIWMRITYLHALMGCFVSIEQPVHS